MAAKSPKDANVVVKTLRLRIKDKHAALLLGQAKEVNFVWNFVNELSHKHTQRTGKFFSSYDIQKYTVGSTKEGLSLHSQTVESVTDEYVTRRRQFKKSKLRWRASQGSKRSLGWIPTKARCLQYRNGQVHYQGKALGLWDSYGLADYDLGQGSFSEDARGRWYLNVTVKTKARKCDGRKSVGIDLGLKEAAITSDGDRLEGRTYRAYEKALGIAQRAGKKDRARAIHAKIKNVRKDQLHQFSTKLVRANAAIFIGNVSSTKLVKTRMAKSTLDAGWGMLKTMLEYKSHEAGVIFEVVNEAYSTQVCSCCGTIPASSPKGRADLGIREWLCSTCGRWHDRDVNAALNILAAGHGRLAGGILVL